MTTSSILRPEADQISCFGGLLFRGWSRWKISDRCLYEDRFARRSQTGSYEDSFGYVQQPCRSDAVKFVTENLLITVYSQGLESAFAFFLPPIGDTRAASEILPELCRDVRAATGRRIVIRGLLEEISDTLLQRPLFRVMSPENYENPRELPEDVFPQVIVRTRLPEHFAGGRSAKIRNHMSHARRRHSFSFLDLNRRLGESMIDVVRSWASAYNDRTGNSHSTGKAPISDMGVDPAAYEAFCGEMAALVDNVRYFGRVMFIDHVPSGFAYVGRTSHDTAALYVSLCIGRIRGASELMIADMLAVLAEHGVCYLNLGGSEGRDLFNYKQKWGDGLLRRTLELEYVD